MKKYIFTALLCGLTLCAQAQRQRAGEYNSGKKISRHYQNESLSKVLEDLNAATSDKVIYFIYDELEDFTVTCRINDLPLIITIPSSAQVRSWTSTMARRLRVKTPTPSRL